MKSKFVFYFIITMMTFALSIQAEEAVKMDHFVNQEKHYSINFPTTWEGKQNFKELDFVIIAPAETPDDLFRQNISIISGKLDQPLTLDEFYKGNLDNLKIALKNFTLVQEEKGSFGGVPVKWITYTHQLSKQTIEVVQYFIVNDHFAYVITGSAEKQKFPRYAETFESIAKTFTLTGG